MLSKNNVIVILETISINFALWFYYRIYFLLHLQLNSKLDKIGSIWSSERGVISLPLYNNSRQGEAFSRECCMIDAIGE